MNCFWITNIMQYIFNLLFFFVLFIHETTQKALKYKNLPLWQAPDLWGGDTRKGVWPEGHSEESRRIHGMSLQFIPDSNSLVYSVMVNLWHRAREEWESGFEMLKSPFSRRVNVCDWIVTQFLMMQHNFYWCFFFSLPKESRGKNRWSHFLLVSITGMTLRPEPGHTHTQICLVPSPK